MNIDHIVNKILNEITNTYSRGGYDYPLQNKILKFKKTSLDPFNVEVNLGDDPEDEIKKNNLNEDLAVWFGKKKKPKGSKQPKGPWVDICRKVNGKHPPCGRKDSNKGSYPKCRGAHAASKMSPGEKRRACRQKRAVERKDTQRGKGQKPNWVSHKKKKKKTNENMKTRIINLNENDLMRIVKRVINESLSISSKSKMPGLNLKCQSYQSTKQLQEREFFNLNFVKIDGNKLIFNISPVQQATMQSYEVESDGGQVIISVEKMTDTLKNYIKQRVLDVTKKEIDLNKTEFKNVMILKGMGQGLQGFCSMSEPLSQTWINVFDNNNIAWDIEGDFGI